MRRRPKPPPPPEELTAAEMAALYRASVPVGWRMDGPEWDGLQHQVTQLLAGRWRRRMARQQRRTPS